MEEASLSASVVYVTVPNLDEAKSIAHYLVENKLVACGKYSKDRDLTVYDNTIDRKNLRLLQNIVVLATLTFHLFIFFSYRPVQLILFPI